MGVDRYHRFLQVARICINRKMKDYFLWMVDVFSFKQVHQLSTDEDKKDSCESADKICDLFYAKDNLGNIEYDDNLLIIAIEVRCKFQKQTIEKLQMMSSKEERDAHLLKMIDTGSAGLVVNNGKKQTSLQVLLSKMNETLKEYFDRDEFPSGITKYFVRQCIGNLERLESKLIV